MAEEQKPLYMKVSLGTIDDLGVKLYSGFPAALAELVANAWDADAERVDILTSEDKIVIKDDGHGMNRDDIQKKYLTIGYRRRDANEQKTPKYERPVMGRKGIGRLALFSIANEVKVYSVKEGKKIGLELSYPEIKKAIQGKNDYYPNELDESEINSEINFDCGTRIELTSFRHKSRGLHKYLRERLSRRFSIIGDKYHFKVFVNNDEVSVSDRNYFSKIQKLWTFGDKDKAAEIKKACCNSLHKHIDKNLIKDNGSRLSGWVGSVFEVNQLMDDGGENFNNIAIMMRGRLAQEDILHSLGKGDVAVKYLIGEIHANYLDRDDEEDMATSGRQHLNQNDDRYQNVKESIRSLVTHICGDWHKLRTDRAKEDILGKNKDIKEWYDELSQDAKKITNKLFKYTATLDDSDRKRDIIRHFVPAVEQMRMRGNLDALSNVSLDNLEQFSELFRNQDEIEAMSYYTITEGRLEIINKLQKYVDEKQLEKIIQEHIYDHLWLLDPSWDRACAEQKLEKRVKRRWKELDDKTGKEVERIKELRIDIQYKKAPEQHVVIELKRPGRKLNHFDLAKQIREYMSAVSKELKDSGRKDNIVEGVIILGEFPIGWESPDEMETGKRTLQESGIRVTTYQEIISQAEKQYKEYIEAQEKASKQIQRIEAIIKSIDV